MKSVLSVLPFVALALAKEPCSQQTFTKTLTNKITVTVPLRTATPVEAPTSAAEPDSTKVILSTVYITPSPAPVPWYPYPNGTFNYTVRLPTTLSTYTLPSASGVEGDASTAVPAPAESSLPAESSYPVSIPTSETVVAVPTSEAASTPKPSNSPVASSEASNSGEATFYGGNVAGGMCSFTGYTIPSGILGTALSDANWANADNCGACVSVTGPDGNSIKAMVVDQCPGCGTNHLDLFPDAFKELADPSKGVIPVSWSVVPCGISSPIVLKNKEGTSKYWFSMQVMNSNVPVSKLEVSTDGGATWQATTRQSYNFFENTSGFGTDSVDVKVTSADGGSVVVNGVSIAAGTTKTAESNFS